MGRMLNNAREGLFEIDVYHNHPIEVVSHCPAFMGVDF